MSDTWTDPLGKTWTVGARVLWAYGRRDYAEFGAFGTIEAVPAAPDATSGLIVRLQPAPESQRERREVEKRKKAGEDVTRVLDFLQEGHLEHGLTTVREAYLVNASRFASIAEDWREMAAAYDDRGLPIEGRGRPMNAQRKPKLLVDFDSVLHAYSRGWADGTAYDPPMPAARESVLALLDAGYDLVVFSTRPAEQIVPWLARYDFPPLRVTNVKEPAVALIDDRAIHHTDWASTVIEVSHRYPAPAPIVDDARSQYADEDLRGWGGAS